MFVFDKQGLPINFCHIFLIVQCKAKHNLKEKGPGGSPCFKSIRPISQLKKTGV